LAGGTLILVAAMIFVGLWGVLHPEDQNIRKWAKQRMIVALVAAVVFYVLTIVIGFVAFGDLKTTMKEAAQEWWQENGSDVISKAVDQLKVKATEAGKDSLKDAWGIAKDWAKDRWLQDEEEND